MMLLSEQVSRDSAKLAHQMWRRKMKLRIALALIIIGLILLIYFAFFSSRAEGDADFEPVKPAEPTKPVTPEGDP